MLNFYTRTKTVTQQWKDDFPTFMASTSNDPLADDRVAPAFDIQSTNGVLLPLHNMDLSNSDGASLALQSKDFQYSDIESLGEHSRDVTNSSGISPAMAVS